MKNFEELKKRVEAYEAASAWGKGVKEYATDLLDRLEEAIKGNWFSDENILSPNLLKKELLNGAADWLEYSEAGNALIYDKDIEERLCTPSGTNSWETWIELQAQALAQAAGLIMRSARYIE